MNIDNNLLDRLKNADEMAFRQIFDYYAPKVYQFIYDYLREKTESEDLTQIVFIKVWQNKANIDIEKSVEGYIFTIAYRNILDHVKLRATKFRQNTVPLSESDGLVSTSTSEEYLNKHEFDSVYNRAIETLPPRRREIFLLSRHQGLTNQEIADQMGISVKTVENQMTAALAAVREFFKLSELAMIPVFLFFF